MCDYIIVREVTDEEAINLLGEEPEDFNTYYIHHIGEDQYILREDSKLLLIQCV